MGRLVHCRTCGQPVAKNAKKCNHCGETRPGMTDTGYQIRDGINLIVAAVVGLTLLVFLANKGCL